MTRPICVSLSLCRIACSSGRQGENSNEWLLQTNLSIEEIQDLAKNYGLEYSHEVIIIISSKLFILDDRDISLNP